MAAGHGCRPATRPANPTAGRMRISRRAAVARAVAGRTPARLDRPRVDGEAGVVDPRRAVRWTGPGRTRTISAVSESVRQTDAGVGDTSRRRDYAGVHARARVEVRPRLRERTETRGDDRRAVKG